MVTNYFMDYKMLIVKNIKISFPLHNFNNLIYINK
jgi:hypothetical protein